MKTYWMIGLAISLSGVLTAAVAQADCQPTGKTRAQLEELKTAKWEIPDQSSRHQFALALAECLGDIDPAIRDGIAYEALQHFLRNKLLTDKVMLALSDRLQSLLVAPDPDGVQRPFAALVLSELVRADRISAYMTPSQRNQIVNAAIAYMLSISDYRGFDARAGYRHAVAHAADLMMQLALNPGIDTKQLAQMRHAIGLQAGTTAASYITGEGERLARAILMIAKRKVFSGSDWTEWFKAASGPGKLGSWDNWFFSVEGIARKHNLTQFASAVFGNAQASNDPDLAILRTPSLEMLKALP